MFSGLKMRRATGGRKKKLRVLKVRELEKAFQLATQLFLGPGRRKEFYETHLKKTLGSGGGPCPFGPY